jgi:hypothetical protein
MMGLPETRKSKPIWQHAPHVRQARFISGPRQDLDKSKQQESPGLYAFHDLRWWPGLELPGTVVLRPKAFRQPDYNVIVMAKKTRKPTGWNPARLSERCATGPRSRPCGRLQRQKISRKAHSRQNNFV